eukprot:SAG22_NODE_10630_length_524_cov_0.828235_1_plen_58_part_01
MSGEAYGVGAPAAQGGQAGLVGGGTGMSVEAPLPGAPTSGAQLEGQQQMAASGLDGTH